MLTGYNTDVSYDGEIFHVQTEDKGIQTPIILSLVYRAGTILAAKRTHYDAHIKDGVVDEAAVSQLLTKQHNLLVAAIKSGKSAKLAELSRAHSGAKTPGTIVAQELNPAPAVQVAPQAVKDMPPPILSAPSAEPSEKVAVPKVEISTPRAIEQVDRSVGRSLTSTPEHRTTSNVAPAPASGKKIYEVNSPPAISDKGNTDDTPGFDQIISGFLRTAASPDQLRIELLYPSKFTAGDEVTVRIAVLYGGHSPASNTVVKLQLLGTRIDPQNLTARTDFQGLVSFHVKIPNFSCGAAALVLTAREPNGQETEMKYMIRKK